MTKQEIEEVLDGGSFDVSILKQRKAAYVASNFGQKVLFTYGDEALEHIKRFKDVEPQKELKGTIANKGYAKGIARPMLMDFNNMHMIADRIASMNKGDILIAETTSPEWMPACEKAAAIVTAQGGLLSHAAVVSREMGIPCIVNVANAMKEIKDGDLVEVDANTGIVKILK